MDIININYTGIALVVNKCTADQFRTKNDLCFLLFSIMYKHWMVKHAFSDAFSHQTEKNLLKCMDKMQGLLPTVYKFTNGLPLSITACRYTGWNGSKVTINDSISVMKRQELMNLLVTLATEMAV